MLCYWILRRPDGSAVGLVRVQNDRVTLKLTAPTDGSFTLFSETSAVPILPESETELPGAQALLGTDGDRVTCFAAAETAAPMSVYCNRLSQNNTIETKGAAAAVGSAIHEPNISQEDGGKVQINQKPAEQEDDISHNSTRLTDSVTDSSQKVQAFSVLLQRSGTFFEAFEENAVDNTVQKEDSKADVPVGIDLFSQEYPGARWRYVEGTDVLPHYEGTWSQPNGQTLHILAVRGYAAPRPPRALLGFTRFLRDRDGTGYWLRLTPLP